MTLIMSKMKMINSTFDNSENRYGLDENQIDLVLSGFINLNYQSEAVIEGSTIQNLRGLTASIIMSEGNSKLEILSSNFKNCKNTVMSIFASSYS